MKVKFDSCSQCGVPTDEGCEICGENVCPYCTDDHETDVHDE